VKFEAKTVLLKVGVYHSWP